MLFWTDEAQSSFEEIKLLPVNSPALVLFNLSLCCIISTDATDYRLATAFAQVQPVSTEKPVAFASCTLTGAERKYSIVEKEVLSCVFASEHQALTTLLSTKGD